MTWFEDLSEYEYEPNQHRPGTKNIGWLGGGHAFETTEPDPLVLDRLWDFCSVSIYSYEGVHDCEFCNADGFGGVAKKNGVRLSLGHSEIRVFGDGGVIYAAPSLIHHYVKAHHYKPPEVFINALMNSVGPPDPAYFDRLNGLGLTWWKATPIGTKRYDWLKPLQDYLEQHLNCRTTERGGDDCRFVTCHYFDLIDHPTATHAVAWTLTPKSEDALPGHFYILFSEYDHEKIKTAIKEQLDLARPLYRMPFEELAQDIKSGKELQEVIEQRLHCQADWVDISMVKLPSGNVSVMHLNLTGHPTETHAAAWSLPPKSEGGPRRYFYTFCDARFCAEEIQAAVERQIDCD